MNSPSNLHTAAYLRELATLGARLAGGDAEALRDLMRLAGTRIERVVRGKLGALLPEADYDDVMSIALYRLWAHRDRFDSSRARLDHWLYVLARNAAIDLLRARRRRQEHAVGDDIERLPEPPPADPAEKRSRLRRDLSHVLESVSEVDKRILLSGLTESELSRELHLKPVTIRVRRSRTKKKVVSALQDMGYVVQKT